MNLSYIKKTGHNIVELFEDLAQLRIQVFRDFPYLYEGTLEYEKEYLETYSRSDKAMVFTVYDGLKMVGATTAIPLADETLDVQAPFIAAGIDLHKIFYFGESILLKPYRGLGLGHRFMDERELHAKTSGAYTHTSFCAVVRPDDHPARPYDYRANDAFWIKRGYVQQPQLQTTFEWPDIGETTSTHKPMIYWMKPIER